MERSIPAADQEAQEAILRNSPDVQLRTAVLLSHLAAKPLSLPLLRWDPLGIFSSVYSLTNDKDPLHGVTLLTRLSSFLPSFPPFFVSGNENQNLPLS